MPRLANLLYFVVCYGQSTVDKSEYSEFHLPIYRVQYAYTAATACIRPLNSEELEQILEQVTLAVIKPLRYAHYIDMHCRALCM
jgi:hypothetical protein